MISHTHKHTHLLNVHRSDLQVSIVQIIQLEHRSNTVHLIELALT